MRSSLDVLHRDTASAVARHLADPADVLRHEPMARTRIAGIETIDVQKVAEYRDQLANYQADAADLERGLTERGVGFLAIIPTATWSKIALESDLYRFTPSPDGTVPASPMILDEAGAYALKEIGNRSLAGLLAGGTGAGALALMATASVLPILGALGVTAAALVAGGFLGGKLAQAFYFTDDAINPTAVAKYETKYVEQAFKEAPSTLFRKLWPVDGVPQKGAINLKVSLPPAPLDAQQNLMAASAAGYKLTLYTVDEAIAFDQNPADTFLEVRQKHWTELDAAWQMAQEAARAKRAEMLANMKRSISNALQDPIVVVQHESATAIIVQYGEFPVEQAVVERVLSGKLL